MNFKSVDWKYFVMFALTVAGVLVPVYLWQSEQAARSISVKLLATSGLAFGPEASFKDLQITLNGQKLDDPYLSLLEVSNDGSKSILPADFDTSLDLVATSKSRIVSAQVTATVPPDIPVKVSPSESKVSISPFLSNPGDVIFFTVITSGGHPDFGVKARIAGIKQVAYEDSSVESPDPVRLGLKVAFMLALCVLYFLFMSAVSRPIIVSGWFAAFAAIGCAAGVGVTLSTSQPLIQTILPSTMGQLVALVVFLVLASTVATRAFKRLQKA